MQNYQKKYFLNQPQGIIKVNGKKYFLKRGTEEALESERDGLHALIKAKHSLHIPKPVWLSHDQEGGFLVMEGLTLRSTGNWQKAAEGLALLHQNEAEFFGWNSNNWIGREKQMNSRSKNWAEFFTNSRIIIKIQHLRALGFFIKKENRLLQIIHDRLANHRPKPSLLHGDLWRGNFGFTIHGATIFDPAIYYGDSEVDIAMSRLFGGFPPEFYQYYFSIMPKSNHSESRHLIYNFYHILNHAIIFSGPYLEECKRYAVRIIQTNYN